MKPAENPKWIDCSKWHASDTDRSQPRTWKLTLAPSFELVVTRYKGYAPDDWVLHCTQLQIDVHLLDSKDAAEAQLEAMGLVRARVAEMSKAVAQMNCRSVWRAGVVSNDSGVPDRTRCRLAPHGEDVPHEFRTERGTIYKSS